MTDELMITHDRPMLDEAGLDLIFRQARTHSAWTDRPIAEELLREIYELAKWGPTAMNGSPMRVVFLTSDEAKARLLPALAPMNVEKSRTAGAVAIIAYDLEFHDKLPKLAPHADYRSMLEGKTEIIQGLATMNGNTGAALANAGVTQQQFQAATGAAAAQAGPAAAAALNALSGFLKKK